MAKDLFWTIIDGIKYHATITHKRVCGAFEVTQAVLQDSNTSHMNLFLNAGFITDNNDYYTKMYLLKNDCPRLILN